MAREISAADDSGLPHELLTPPQAYVAFLGLNIQGNPLHSTIWESFNANRRSDKSPLSLKLVNDGHRFPPKKPKKQSFEWHVPKGILKINWLKKHLNYVPAVAVLFYELDWDDAQWPDKMMDVVKHVMTLRENLKDRNSKIALVLIQRNIPLPGTENIEATEKAAELCNICELSVKSLFALPHSDHLHGYTMRMEGAFCELAQNYYQQEAKRIKNNRDNLNKTTQQLLFVRYQFKMAFYNELKQDLLQAVKNYKQAYANLMEVRASDTNMVEVKTVGGFINYKICSLSFILNKPLDSISQFRKHMDIFRSKVGAGAVSFEHSSWMAMQYAYFGDLFEEAVNLGLTAIQTQHPGFYYQQAANCAVNRKQLCHRLCQERQVYPDPDPLENSSLMEFYGQRPWRAGIQSMEPADLPLERQGLTALQIKEKDVDHSGLIIGHLRNAVSQFKKYRCPRMKRQLLVQMAEEYHCSKENSKALALLSHVLWDYRTERWCPLVSNILLTALECAFLCANVQEYVSLGLEAIGSWIQCSNEEKVVIQSNVNHILTGNVPLPMANLSQEDVETSCTLWKDALSGIKGKPVLFTVPMKNSIPFVDCKAQFASQTFRADENVTLKVYLRLNSPQPVKFSKLSVIFGNLAYNPHCEIPGKNPMLGENGNLYLVPGKTRMFTFSFLPLPVDVNGSIQITSVCLQLGNEETICAILVWAESGKESLIKDFSLGQMTPIGDRDINFQEIVELMTTSVIPREPRLNIQVNHYPPLLLGEFYPLHVSISSQERNAVSDLHVSLSLMMNEHSKDDVENTVFSDGLPNSKSSNILPLIEKVSFGKVLPGATVERCFYVRAKSLSTRQLHFLIGYATEVDVEDQVLNCECLKEEIIHLPVQEPFTSSAKLLNFKFEAIPYARAQEEFFVALDIKSDAHVQLEAGQLTLAKGINSCEGSSGSQLSGLELKEGEIASECFCVSSPSALPEPIPLGKYTLTWRRHCSEFEIPWVEHSIVLPFVSVVSVPLHATLEAPAHGWVRTPMTITYTLYNRSDALQELALVVDASHAFMFSGNKQLHFWILPGGTYKLVFNLYPLVSGHVHLPKLRLLMNPGKSSATSLDDHLQQLLPTHIFIMPQGRKITVEDDVRSA